MRQGSIGDVPDGIVESLVESECSVHTQGLIGRTGRLQRVARCPCLGGHRTNAGHEEGHEVKERHDEVVGEDPSLYGVDRSVMIKSM